MAVYTSPRHRPRRASRLVWRFAASAVTLAVTLATLGAAPAFAQGMTFEGTLLGANGGPAADGEYDMAFGLYAQQVAGQPVWSEGPVKVQVAGGFFSYTLGSSTPLDAAAVAALDSAWLGVAIANDPELPRSPVEAVAWAMHAASTAALTCSGCITTDMLGAASVSAAAADFPYAGSLSKGGAASDLACTGCVNTEEMTFDGDMDLGVHGLTSAAVQTGSVVATGSVAATEFVGDGSKLSGITVPQGDCGAGTSLTGVDAQGQLVCSEVAASLPKDAVDDLSNNVLTNEFVDSFAAAGLPLGIKDNFPIGVSMEIDVPDVGLAKSLTVTVALTNSDIKDIEVYLYDPNNVEYTLYNKASSGGSWSGSFPSPDTAESGDLSTWYGKNAQGKWLLKVIDSNFLDNTTDGEISEFKIAIQTVSNKKLDVNGGLVITGDLQAGGIKLPTIDAPCDASLEGVMRYANKRVEQCDGTAWDTLGETGALYRWNVFDTYARWGTGWFLDNRSELFGGVAPSNWTGNYRAYQMSSDSQVLRSFFTRQGPSLQAETHNAMVYNETWRSYGDSNQGRHVIVMFRVRNSTAQSIGWTVDWYGTAYGGWNDRTSVAINGQEVWQSGSSNIYAWEQRSTTITVPANRTSTVIFVAASTPEQNGFRDLILAFFDNSLQLPTGLEFVDDLDTKPNGWDN